MDGVLFCDRNYWYSRAGPGEEDYPFPAPFDTGFYLIMNVAVGGSFTGGLIDEVRKGGKEGAPAAANEGWGGVTQLLPVEELRKRGECDRGGEEAVEHYQVLARAGEGGRTDAPWDSPPVLL